MEHKEAENRAAELSAVIEKHNHNYYDLDSPTIEDDEYDALMRELRGIVPRSCSSGFTYAQGWWHSQQQL